MSIRLGVSYARIPTQSVQRPQKLDRASQRALIFSSASFPARVLLRFPTPECQSNR